MKKLSILLIGLLLVSGLAFAEFGAVSVDGSASVTFGVDLNTNFTGFANAGSSSVEITLIDEDTAEATGDDGLYGTITIDEYSLSIEDGVIVSDLGSVTASITVDPATITIYSAPSFSMDMAETIDSGTVEGDISTSIANVNGSSVNGITISVPAGPATIDLKVASDGDWTENAANEYVIGTDITLDVAPATVELGFVYGWFGAAVLGISAGVELDVAPATITLGFDGSDASGSFDFDIAAGAAVAVGEGTDVSLDAYVYTGGATTDLDLVIGFEEEEEGGLVDMLYATIDVEVLDVLDVLAWNLDVAGGYNTGDLEPYFGFGYGSDSIFDLNVGVMLYAGLTGIDNTTITIDYVSTDLSTDNGVITVETEVSL